MTLKKLQIATLAAFLIVPLALLGFILFCPDRAVSENENRTLKTTADVSWNVADGSFQDWLEDYLSDQFPLRDAIKQAEIECKLALGVRGFDGAYAGKDGRLFQKITEADVNRKACLRYARRVERLAEETGLPTYVMYVPSAGVALREELPAGAPMYDYDSLYDALRNAMPAATLIDVKETLSGSPRNYYATDHHWTGQGAALAYEAWRQAHGKPWESGGLVTVDTAFHGTLYSKVPSRKIPFDTIKTYLPENEPEVVADGEIIPFFDEAALCTKDKYNFFQGGNHGITVITNPQKAQDAPVLLLLKDSFANSLVPYLTEDYRTVVMIDERYAFVDAASLAEEYHASELAVVREIISVP